MLQEINQPTFYCSLLYVMFVNMSQLFINACLLLPQSYVRGLFTNYKSPQQSVFSRNSLHTFYSRNPTCEIPPCLRISNHKYPPPPSPSETLKAVRGIGMDIFWNRPMSIKPYVQPLYYNIMLTNINNIVRAVVKENLWEAQVRLLLTMKSWVPSTISLLYEKIQFFQLLKGKS